MTKSLPLRLENLIFPVVSVRAEVPKESQKRGDFLLKHMNVEFVFDYEDSGKRAAAALKVETKKDCFEQLEDVPSYSIEVEGVAYFDVMRPEDTDDRATYFRKFAAVSALIGAVREQISMTTARGPWGSMYMPILDVNSIIGPLPPKPDQPSAAVPIPRKRAAKAVEASKS